MKVNMMLFAGAIAGLSMIAAPALSQDRPTTPQRPTTAPGGQQTEFHTAMKMLEGTWQVAARYGNDQAASGGKQIQGTSTRQWILDEKILQEEVRTNGSSTLGLNEQVTPGQPQRPNNQPLRDTDLDNFEGHGMFGYDQRTNQFQHVWADSKDSALCFSSGRYDERTRTFTFNAVRAGGASVPPSTRPTVPPTTTPNTPPPTAPPSTPPTNPTRPGSNPGMEQVTTPTQPNTPPSPPRPTTQPSRTDNNDAKFNIHDVSRIVIRIMDENRHVVEYFGDGQNRLMEITYTKGGAMR